MADDYRRGYSKGYATGMARGNRFMDRLIRVAKEQRERSERAEAGLRLGICKECRHWSRGPGHPADDRGNFKWGICTRFGKGSEGIDLPWFGEHQESLSTQEHFGCVLFAPRDGSGDA